MITSHMIPRSQFSQQKRNRNFSDGRSERYCICRETPFYATMGGQEGDKGVIETANGKFVVEDTIKLRGGKFGHVGHVWNPECFHRRDSNS